MTEPATRPAVRDPLAGVDLEARLRQQLAFVVEIDRVKQVLRQTPLSDNSRREDDAQHQWHLAVMALVLAEHAASPVDVARVLTMVLVHDLVEIDAGDADLYDPVARASAADKEAVAADRIFGLLPPDQGQRFREAWEEFEEGRTGEAQFARSLDRLQPLLLNAASGGGSWRARGLDASRVRETAASAVGPGAPGLAAAALGLVAAAVADGILPASSGAA